MPTPPDIRAIEAPPGSEIAILQAFVRANAHSAASACGLDALGVEVTPVFERLHARRFLYRTSDERWYLDMPRYLAHRFHRRVLMSGASVVAIGLLTWFLIRAL